MPDVWVTDLEDKKMLVLFLDISKPESLEAECIGNLWSIIDHTGCKLVGSVKPAGLEWSVIDITNDTPQEWLAAHPEVKKFCVLSDGAEALPGYVLIEDGLSYKNIVEAIKILGPLAGIFDLKELLLWASLPKAHCITSKFYFGSMTSNRFLSHEEILRKVAT